MSSFAFVSYIVALFGFFVGAMAAVHGHMSMVVFCSALLIAGAVIYSAESRRQP